MCVVCRAALLIGMEFVLEYQANLLFAEYSNNREEP